MRVGSIGYNYIHDKSFKMELPEGPGAWLFLLIKTPTRFELGGEVMTVKENFCVLLEPSAPCSYSAAGETYTDDWLYIDAGGTDMEQLRAMGIPFNEVIPLSNIEELTRIMHILTYEHYSEEAHHEEISRRYLELLFLKLARMIGSGTHLSKDSFTEKNARLTHIRTRIFTDPRSVGNIDSLAAEAGMSRSGFQHSYKRMFGVNVMSDIVTGRLECAKRLLTFTSLTVEEVAEQCGYSSPFSFMRQFKQRCGRTPTEYRKTDPKNGKR